MSRSLLQRLFFLLCVSVSIFSASRARADFLLSEENSDDEWHHRSFAATGYLQAGFLWRQNDVRSPISDDQFLINRARFGFRARLHKWLLLRFELETSPAPAATDMFVEMPFSPMFTMRVGQFTVPFLRVMQYPELGLSFIDRPLFLPQSPDRRTLGVISLRDIGVMFSGIFGNHEPARHAPALQYFAGAFLGRGPNQIVNDDNAFMYAGRLMFHVFGVPEHSDVENDLHRNDFPRVAVGVGAYTNCDDRGNWNRGWTFDTELRYRGLFASVAFIRFRNGGVNGDGLGNFLGYGGSCGSGLTGGVDSLAWGLNAQVQYVLPHQYFPFAEQSLELMTRFDTVAPNNPVDGSFLGGGVSTPGYNPPSAYNDTDNSPTAYRMTFGVNWYPTSQQPIRLSVNYQLNREIEHVVVAGQEILAIKNDILWAQLTAGF